LPVVGAVRESKTGFAGKPDHRLVGAQGIAEHTPGAEGGGAALQIAEQSRADAVPLPAVVDRQAELETVGPGVEGIAGFAGDGLMTVDRHGRDRAEAVVLAGTNEMREQPPRQFADGAEKAVVAGAGREAAEIALQRLGVIRLDQPHLERPAASQPQDIGMLPQLVEAKRG